MCKAADSFGRGGQGGGFCWEAKKMSGTILPIRRLLTVAEPFVWLPTFGTMVCSKADGQSSADLLCLLCPPPRCGIAKSCMY